MGGGDMLASGVGLWTARDTQIVAKRGLDKGTKEQSNVYSVQRYEM